MHVSLIVPAPFDTLSGGYEYDRRMLAGLLARGHTAVVIELPAHEAGGARAALARVPAAGRCLIDGLALPAFTGLEAALEACSAVALIHHPLSLETGLENARKDALATLEAAVLPRFPRVIVTSETTAGTLTEAFGVNAERIRIVTPGVDDLTRSEGSGQARCELLSVGALIPRKGHDVLIRALARLFDLDWNLTIVGAADRDPDCAASLGVLVTALGVTDRVTFTGALTPEAAETHWRRADVFALATYYEGYGMAIAEALRRGLPVAVTAGGAAGALVGPEAGVVCQPNDREQLSRALRRLIFSRELRTEMGEVAWQSGQTLPSWTIQVEQFAAALTF